MPGDDGDRTRHWPAIERRHGRPMAYWFDAMQSVEGRRYADQMAFLQDEHGFSRAHANALVMYTRGSTTSKRFATVDQYLEGVDPAAAQTVRGILAVLQRDFPELRMVMAWNQPMLRSDEGYVFGVSAAKRHVLMAPWSAEVLDRFRPRLAECGLTVNKKTVRVPNDWEIDEDLLRDMVTCTTDGMTTG